MIQSIEKDNLIIARFFPKDNVFEKLKDLCSEHKIKTGVVLSGVGQLGFVEVGFFKEKGNYMNQKFEKPLEVLGITGTISESEEDSYDFHLHISLSDENKNVIGGHFIEGVVSVTLEIVILKTGIKIQRKVEEETGLKGLFLD